MASGGRRAISRYILWTDPLANLYNAERTHNAADFWKSLSMRCEKSVVRKLKYIFGWNNCQPYILWEHDSLIIELEKSVFVLERYSAINYTRLTGILDILQRIWFKKLNQTQPYSRGEGPLCLWCSIMIWMVYKKIYICLVCKTSTRNNLTDMLIKFVLEAKFELCLNLVGTIF